MLIDPLCKMALRGIEWVKLLLDLGVPAEHIVEFAESQNTVDDALQSRPIVDTYDAGHLDDRMGERISFYLYVLSGLFVLVHLHLS